MDEQQGHRKRDKAMGETVVGSRLREKKQGDGTAKSGWHAGLRRAQICG